VILESGRVLIHLASVMLTEDAQLWTRDKRLAEIASRLRCAFHEG